MPEQPPSTAPRFGGLDGLRAIAVGMVLVYHFFPRALPGGFLGVDVFFAISGFLITSLLLRELAATGRVDLISFWRRRARRLLPAVTLVVLVSTSLALAASRDLLVGIARQIAGAVFFVSNWVFIANGSDYFARDTPELFRNFWSLALEEQFYIVLPILAFVLFGLRARSTRAIPLIVLGVASALLMGGLAVDGIDPTRIYFGSDSHSFGLLLGAAMAVLLQRVDRRPLGPAGQALSLVVALGGFAVLGFLALTLPEASRKSFTGGFQLATLAALAVVWAITREGAWIGRAIDVLPLRWIGERSYGIYLWHWPLLLIATSIFARALPRHAALAWVPQLVALALTLVLAALSYRYVELPVRRVGLRGAFRLWFSPRKHTPRRRAIAVSLASVLAIAFPLTGLAVTIAPEQTSSAHTILRGKKMLDAQRRGHGAASTTSPTSPTPVPPAVPDPTAAPAAFSFEGRDITAIGDSVMLASYPELAAEFPGIDVDAAVSRGLRAGVGIVSSMASAGKLRPVVVVGLGTNGPIDVADLVELRRATGVRPIVLVNAHAEREWIPSVNSTLEAFAAATPGVTLARWNEAISPEPDSLADDGIHPGSRGGEIYAAAVRRACDDLSAPGEGIGWVVSRR